MVVSTWTKDPSHPLAVGSGTTAQISPVVFCSSGQRIQTRHSCWAPSIAGAEPGFNIKGSNKNLNNYSKKQISVPQLGRSIVRTARAKSIQLQDWDLRISMVSRVMTARGGEAWEQHGRAMARQGQKATWLNGSSLDFSEATLKYAWVRSLAQRSVRARS